MRRKGWIASGLFAAMCFAGIITLITQASISGLSHSERTRSQRTALDPADEPSQGFGQIVPLSLRKGAEVQTEEKKAGKAEGKRILRLR